MRKLLIVIDMQNDFIFGSLKIDKAKKIISPIKDIIKHFLKNNHSVVFTLDTHDDNLYLDSLEGKGIPIKHCIKGTLGHRIIPSLEEFARDKNTLLKNGFAAKDLISLCEGFDEIYLCGVCTDICVIANGILLRGHFPNKKIFVLGDLCFGTDKESHQNAIKQMEKCLIKNIKGEDCYEK